MAQSAERLHKHLRRYPHEVFAKIESECGERLIIPHSYPQGIQPPREYLPSKQISVRNELATNGIDYLLQFPVWACAIPTPAGLSCVVFDGHHRTRNAPLFGIYRIPTILFSLEYVAKAHQKSIDRLVIDYETAVAETNEGFSLLMGAKGKTYHPQVIPGIQSIAQLLVSAPTLGFGRF